MLSTTSRGDMPKARTRHLYWPFNSNTFIVQQGIDYRQISRGEAALNVRVCNWPRTLPLSPDNSAACSRFQLFSSY